MKFLKTSFVVALLLLCTLQSHSAVVITSFAENQYDIEQSPLSDDETNPVSTNTTDVAEFDVEDKDENNSSSTNLKLVSFVKSNIHVQSFISSNLTNAYKQHLHFSKFNSGQSYLQVFRI